ncbi:glycosyltransferase [Albibacterium bauzanense]|uniref:UDP-N-acetylglucosamine transferase subunit ALG13 n=1 Tax=Albibacterium bauzanense TaxID=653929 RepID=A0A4R1M5G7_9SPHI|nr:glycosyltransferase [Albibacterium bauzanense]TCK84949.1 UDP-N-acetylglucosamine transferase subunit ALG13 [Albibacterium bauzanense]
MKRIFVTIGTQVPFDRLISAMDEIVGQLNESLTLHVFAQTVSSKYKPKNMEWTSFMSPSEFNRHLNEADLIVAHAGMGTIISALTLDKPIIVLPRLLIHNEIRSDHQISTCRTFDKLKYVHVIYNESELKTKVEDILTEKIEGSLHKITNFASAELILSIKNELQ